MAAAIPTINFASKVVPRFEDSNKIYKLLYRCYANAKINHFDEKGECHSWGMLKRVSLLLFYLVLYIVIWKTLEFLIFLEGLQGQVRKLWSKMEHKSFLSGGDKLLFVSL